MATPRTTNRKTLTHAPATPACLEASTAVPAPAPQEGTPKRASSLTVSRIIEMLADGLTIPEIAQRLGRPIWRIQERLASPAGKRQLAAFHALAQVRMQLMAAQSAPRAISCLKELAASTTEKGDTRLRSCLGVIDVARDTAVVEPAPLPVPPAENQPAPRPRNEMEQAMAKAFDILAAEADQDRRDRQAALRAQESPPATPPAADH